MDKEGVQVATPRVDTLVRKWARKVPIGIPPEFIALARKLETEANNLERVRDADNQRMGEEVARLMIEVEKLRRAVAKLEADQPSPHVPAAFINAIADEGTKAEAVDWLQKEWDENCRLRAELAALRSALPKEPPIELLVSMALRVNHGFGLDDERSQEVQLADMRKVYEEVSGHGFYSEDTKVRYSGFLRRKPSATTPSKK